MTLVLNTGQMVKDNLHSKSYSKILVSTDPSDGSTDSVQWSYFSVP